MPAVCSRSRNEGYQLTIGRSSPEAAGVVLETWLREDEQMRR